MNVTQLVKNMLHKFKTSEMHSDLIVFDNYKFNYNVYDVTFSCTARGAKPGERVDVYLGNLSDLPNISFSTGPGTLIGYRYVGSLMLSDMDVVKNTIIFYNVDVPYQYGNFILHNTTSGKIVSYEIDLFSPEAYSIRNVQEDMNVISTSKFPEITVDDVPKTVTLDWMFN